MIPWHLFVDDASISYFLFNRQAILLEKIVYYKASVNSVLVWSLLQNYFRINRSFLYTCEDANREQKAFSSFITEIRVTLAFSHFGGSWIIWHFGKKAKFPSTTKMPFEWRPGNHLLTSRGYHHQFVEANRWFCLECHIPTAPTHTEIVANHKMPIAKRFGNVVHLEECGLFATRRLRVAGSRIPPSDLRVVGGMTCIKSMLNPSSASLFHSIGSRTWEYCDDPVLTYYFGCNGVVS